MTSIVATAADGCETTKTTEGARETKTCKMAARTAASPDHPIVNGNGTSVAEGTEEILEVSKEIASWSLGFSIDAGGSVTKLVYRSKEDYENGKLKDAACPHGKLRLRYMPNEDPDGLIDFIGSHCDVIASKQPHGPRLTEESSAIWYQTGVGYQHYMTKIDKAFDIRTRLMSEAEAHIKGIFATCAKSELNSDCLQRPLPMDPTALDWALNYVRTFMKMRQNLQASGDTLGNFMKPPEGFNIAEYATKIMTSDGVAMSRDLSQTEIEFPCLFVLIGSAMVVGMLQENGNFTVLDFGTNAGKTFLAIGMALTGAKDFMELAEMARRGDSRKVDTMAGDLRNKEREGSDWYTLMEDDLHVFALGKLTESKYSGTYTKEDIAAAFLNCHCRTIVKTILPNAKLHRLKSVVFGGSFVSHSVVRHCVERHFHASALLEPFSGGAQMRMAVLPHSGFMCALGTWCKNLELERETTKTAEQSAN